MSGKLICLYGINNIGKSTQAKLLVDRLKEEGHDTENLKFPNYDLDPSGSFINSVLRESGAQNIAEEELQMWYTLNRFQYQPQLRAQLDAGKVVIAEDYIGTGLAWGSAKGASPEWLKCLNEPLIPADLSILMDGARFTEAKEEQHIHESNDELVEKCRARHLELGKEYDWKLIAANRDKGEISDDIFLLVSDFLKG